MTQEEKAKAYDESFGRAMNWYNAPNVDKMPTYANRVIEEIFPELKESEDERIRQRIIQAIRLRADDMNEEWSDEITWLEKQNSNVANKEYWRGYREGKKEILDKYAELEKQGEQKPTDKVEPKFKIGDWAVSNLDKKARQISEVYFDEYNNYYIVESNEYDIEEYDRLHHLWIIQDAKDGDILAYGDNPNDHHAVVIMIFKSLRTEKSAFTYFHIFADSFRIDDWCDCGKNVHPATKEQRNLLFQKIKEGGYKWDSEKKELKKIIDEKQIKKNLQDNSFRRMFEQKPAWSEEDKMFVHGLIRGLATKRDIHGHTTFSSDCIDITNTINWLESLKDRVQSPPKQEWSEEDDYNV